MRKTTVRERGGYRDPPSDGTPTATWEQGTTASGGVAAKSRPYTLMFCEKGPPFCMSWSLYRMVCHRLSSVRALRVGTRILTHEAVKTEIVTKRKR